MPKPDRSPQKTTDKTTFVLGRDRLEKISAVEGIATGSDTREMFAAFERQRLSPAERRAAILKKHTRKR